MSFLRRIMYTLWYIHRPPWDSGITPPELVEFIKTLPVGRAIDLGCGTGTNAISLSRLGWQVTGVDFVPSAIHQGMKKAIHEQVKVDLRVGNVTSLDGIEGPFDFALDLGCFHSLEAKEKIAYLDQLNRVLRPGGTWFLYAFLATELNQNGVGLSEGDFLLIKTLFKLRSRSDGYDRGNRPSAYFIFDKLNNDSL